MEFTNSPELSVVKPQSVSSRISVVLVEEAKVGDRQDMQEAEGVTPPRKDAHGHGGRRAPESQLHPRGTQVVPQIFTDVRTRDVGSDRRNDVWSPENVLVDTVARLQQDWQISELNLDC